MLNNVGIDIQGLKGMEAALLDIAKEVGAQKATGMMTSALKKGGEKYTNHMKRKVNVSSASRIVTTKSGKKVTITPGFLKSRIKVKGSTSRGRTTKKMGKNVVSRVQAGVFKVPYVVQQEYGTQHTRANPIIRNAFRQRTRQVTHVVNHELGKKIERARKTIARRHAKKAGKK